MQTTPALSLYMRRQYLVEPQHIEGYFERNSPFPRSGDRYIYFIQGQLHVYAADFDTMM
jgi:hypothetical protein